jgi:hypothetical protein
LVGVVASCGGSPAEPSGGSGTSGAAGTSSSEGGSISSSGGGPGFSDGTGDTSSGASSSEGPNLDLPPFPEACLQPSPTIVVERAVSPQGVLSFDEAWIVTDWCSRAPALVVRDPTQRLKLTCLPQGEGFSAPSRPLDGDYPCAPILPDGTTGTLEVLTPYDDPDPNTASVGVSLHARLVLQGAGWDVSVLVTAQDCGEQQCFCACE